MLDYRKLDEERRKEQCLHRGGVYILGGVEHCVECGAILSSVDHLYRIWRRCRENLGLAKKGHDFGKEVKK